MVVVVVRYCAFSPATGVQTVAVQLLPAEAATDVQLFVKTSGVTTVLQVVVVHPLPAPAVPAVQEAEGTFVVLFGVQVVVVQLFTADGRDSVQF